MDFFGNVCGCGFFILWLAVIGFAIAGIWKTFEKAGKPGWASIVPFYNMYVLTEISGREILWFILLFIPIANIVAAIVISIDVARKFGRSDAFGIGLALLAPIFFCILGFGQDKYRG